MDNRISRYGAYGLLTKDDQILLILKKSGPYKGQWDLPGGAIEFGETPEEALKREFLEEAALAIGPVELLCVATAKVDHFHHVGIIYRVISSSSVAHLLPEDEGQWMNIKGIDVNQLTPFAKQVIENYEDQYLSSK